MLQLALAFAVPCGLVLILGGPFIRALRARKIGDNPEFDQADINQLMNDKRGTPTMGGLLIVAAIVVGVVVAGDRTSLQTWLAVGCAVAFSLLGVADDWFKLNKHHYAAAGAKIDRQGLSSRAKLIVQFMLAGVLAAMLLRSNIPIDTFRIPLVGTDMHLTMPVAAASFFLIAVMVIVGASNAVNLTDGLDGLAAGCVTVAAGVFMVIALRESSPQIAVTCASICGACVGFLWFNANPARIFMGDTGSLALGGLLGFVAVSLRHELLLAVVGVVFVIEALSVMLQVGYFKYTRRKFGTGRRIFLMSPLHHHFQKLGWPEPRIVIRFWIIAILAGIAGLLLGH